MSHLLDRPVWSALASTHAGLAVGDGAARRYRPGLVSFAAARDADPDAGAALVRLVGHQDSVVLVEAEPVALPPGLVATSIVSCRPDAFDAVVSSGRRPPAGAARPR